MWDKYKRTLNHKIILTLYNTPLYLLIYYSYWHSKLIQPAALINSHHYLTATPNKGAGIGHQMANWIAGVWFADFFNINYAHTEFTPELWENFLGFGESEVSVKNLTNKNGYKKVYLPLFNENNSEETDVIKKIIRSYSNCGKILFILEQDQFHYQQYKIIKKLKNNFFNAKARSKDKLVYSKNFYNIAVHIRRGDIDKWKINGNKNLKMRWQDIDYFKNIIDQISKVLNGRKNYKIYIFSQGEESDFNVLEELAPLNYCLKMTSIDSFLHMVFADLLVTSKSSFSYNPGLISNGIKIAPRNFWHGYPDNNWIMADENGSFNIKELQNYVS